MNYTIAGCITQYGVDDIRPYIESIEKSGFNGEKIMLVYEVSTEVIEYLTKKGWIIFQSELQEHIILQRFRDMYVILNQYKPESKYEWIIWTDVKDVIFQKNPIEWIENNKEFTRLFAFSESIKLKDDPWAVVNSGTTFPLEWHMGMQDQISYCAGTIVGDKTYIKDLFLQIYHWSKATANPGQLSDQAAFNILIHLEQFNSTKFVKQEEGFVTQLGTVWVKGNELPILEPTPIYKDGKFYNQNGDEFVIVHQYDRDPKIKQQIKELYK
jgi:hypothetical protein